MSFRLCVRDGFAAAHRLAGSGGRCERPHGHNFAVELAVEGDTLDPVTGMLVDFAELKGALARALADLDHSDLNQHPALAGKSPSSEVIARTVFDRVRGELAGRPVRVESVTVWESEKASATYRPGGAG